MSSQATIDERDEPFKDPVDKFMQQLATSAAQYRRSITGGPPVVVANALAGNSETAAMLAAWKAEEALRPAIERVAVSEAEEIPGCWVVDAIDSENALLRAVFDGPDAEQRALEYARWKYGGEG